MSKSNSPEAQHAMHYDIWFSGQHTEDEEGNISFFLCQYFEKLHYDEASGEYIKWCKFYKRPEDGSSCNMSCPQFGMCDTCSGFSAVRCTECHILRPEKPAE